MIDAPAATACTPAALTSRDKRAKLTARQLRGSPMRKPSGYVGRRHETIGSDILAVQKSLQWLAEKATQRLPAQIMGPEHLARLATVKPDQWYPIDWLLELMDRIESRIGRYALMKMGRELFILTHEGKAALASGRDVVFGIDGMYHATNRGEHIGGWRVVSFEPDRAVLEKTTPHHCAMEEGILLQALHSVQVPAVVTQERCVYEDAELCEFLILPSVSGRPWSG
jgi:hypothetical protein